MCGLFGFSRYGEQDIKDLSDLTNSLARQSAVRGTDATGIAVCNKGQINIVKESKAAYDTKLKHKDNVRALTGHTRHSTQGSEKRNYNNHPFHGKAGHTNFALAHNGVLMNDRELRRDLQLPKTKIETDSYIAVQLVEKKKELTFESLKYMAETVEGSFSFSLLDDKDNLYLVKGDSPITLLHFPAEQIYVYASTDNILYKALVDSSLFTALKRGNYEELFLKAGDILRIDSNGKMEKGSFTYKYSYGRSWWDYGGFDYTFGKADKEYIDCLKTAAGCEGYAPDEIDYLIEQGFTLDEIEEYIYNQ
jgi:glucosamine 6-phosphate synthetase-like amidotransferase/phosphosugar isomerase protein